MDLADENLALTLEVISGLNSAAPLIQTQFSQAPISSIFDLDDGDSDRKPKILPARPAVALKKAGNGRYGISSFVYTAKRPFHPQVMGWSTLLFLFASAMQS